MPGPPPKPTALKILEGNPGNHDLSMVEPEPTKGAPKPPPDLTGEAFAEWCRIVPELDRLGLLTLVDRAALVVYCRAWATYCAASLALDELGPLVEGRDGFLVKNPAAQVARDAADLMIKYGGRFGFTPSDRVRLAVPAEGKPDPHEGEIMRLLG